MSCKICEEPLDRHQACDMYACLMELSKDVSIAIDQIGNIKPGYELQLKEKVRNLLEDKK